MHAPWKKSYDKARQHVKKQRRHFAYKGLFSQSYAFSSGHVWMLELDHKENWALKNWCFWTVVLEKTLESPLDCKGIQPVHPKGNQSWIFIRRADAEAEALILWPPDAKSWLSGKDPDAGKDWRQEEKGTTEDEKVGWHHRLNGRWVGASSGSWWWTRRPGVLQSMGLQRVGHDWATEQQPSKMCITPCLFILSLIFKQALNQPKKKKKNPWNQKLFHISKQLDTHSGQR